MITQNLKYFLLIKDLSDKYVMRFGQNMKGDDAQPLRWTASSLGALHEGAEAYLLGMFENAYLCTRHAKRKTLLPKDIENKMGCCVSTLLN